MKHLRRNCVAAFAIIAMSAVLAACELAPPALTPGQHCTEEDGYSWDEKTNTCVDLDRVYRETHLEMELARGDEHYDIPDFYPDEAPDDFSPSAEDYHEWSRVGVVTAEPSGGGPPVLSSGCLDWSTARHNVGRSMCYCGPVVSTVYAAESKGQPTFLNIGGDAENPNRLTAVIWGNNRVVFSAPPEDYYRNARICVSGMVAAYKGVAQIAVSSPLQIVDISSQRPSPANDRLSEIPTPHPYPTRNIWKYPSAGRGVANASNATPEPINAPVVSLQRINLRMGPGPNYKTIHSVTENEACLVLDHSGHGIWLLVRCADGKEGWVMAWMSKSR